MQSREADIQKEQIKEGVHLDPVTYKIVKKDLVIYAHQGSKDK